MTASEKAPYAALRFIFPLDRLGAGLFPVTVSLSNRARLASGAFCEAVPKLKLHHFFTRR
jgi:hypothetical protein